MQLQSQAKRQNFELCTRSLCTTLDKNHSTRSLDDVQTSYKVN